ncbi:MAG: ThiF family adenylyltransferase [Pirellulaceae bacterium]|nr:ThiF family adenylyltransferase [Pirellulaceae bacterium]
MTTDLDLQSSRYARQMRFAPLGVAGQRKLLAARALVVGCGALGAVIANTLARAGVGKLRIVDRDFLELNNLQRQVLYDEDDVAAGLPKAIAARNRLVRINSQIEIDAEVADVDHTNIERLLAGVDCLVDGTDNFETRFLLNDAAVKLGIPWVYGGCLGAEGQSLTILPGETPCLRCLMPDPPPPGSTPTCDSAGILATIIGVIASLEASEALKILSGNRAAISRTWTVLDLWENTLRQIKLADAKSADCPCCGRREFPWLSGERGSHTAVLCGRNAVQLSFPGREPISLEAVAERLATVGQVTRNKYLVRATIGSHLVTIFPDGRAVIGGTEDIAEARSIYAKFVGN